MTDTASGPAEKIPFHLRGNYAPVGEERTELSLEIDGVIPPELSGLYVRNGANPKSGTSPHWFAGDGMLHGVHLGNGSASWYRNRWVKTRLLDDPTARSVGPDGTVDLRVGPANTNVVRHAGRILALAESSVPCEVGPDLETIGWYDYDGRLSTAMTAHPKECPTTGELHFFGYSFFEPYLTYHRVDADGVLVQTEVIDVPGPTMVHDFSITESNVIFMDLPIVFDLDLAMSRRFPYRWDDDYGARVGVMPRNAPGVQPRWFEVEPCYVFHPLNSFEEGSRVVVDTARYPEMWRATSQKFVDTAALHRWELDLATGGVTETVLDDREIEFPRVPDALVGLPNRFGYAVSSLGESSALVKYDLESATSTVHEFGEAKVAGEAVFVPADSCAGPDDAAEDEGWLLAFAHDKPTDRSELVILDASDLEADPVATVHLPVRIPFGFHGNWMADSDQ